MVYWIIIVSEPMEDILAAFYNYSETITLITRLLLDGKPESDVNLNEHKCSSVCIRLIRL